MAAATTRPAAAPRAPSASPPPPPSISREVAKFVVATLVASLVFVAASLPLLRHFGRVEAIRDARSRVRLAAAGIAEPALRDGLLRGDPAALARIDRVVQERVLSDTIVRVKIWGPDGRILYSDEPRLIGARYPLGPEERQALAIGSVDAEVSDLRRPENRFERAEGQLLEVYSRIRTPNGTPVLFEWYERFDSVLASGRRIWVGFLPALLAALAMLWIVQVPLAYRLARRLRRGQEERELLLQRALDASNDERRRIAGDLHDGVVQDLAGVSYSLAAATRSDAASRDRSLRAALDEGAAVTRESVQRLRSLLLAIHPPNVRVTGLEAALRDLTAPLRRQGIDAELTVDETLALAPETEALVFRAAREAIRNVLDHAGARSVTVRVVRAGEVVRLTVADDGRGFDAAELERRRGEGHVGLSLLEELAAHEGARLEIASEPGSGTTVVLEAPVP